MPKVRLRSWTSANIWLLHLKEISVTHLMVRLPVIISHLPLLEDLPVGLHLVVLLQDLPGAHHPLVAVPAHSELEALEHGADVGLLEHL